MRSSKIDSKTNLKNSIPKKRSSLMIQSFPQGPLRADSRFHILVLLILSAIGVITFSACGEKPLPDGEKEFAEGVKALEFGDTALAHSLFVEAERNDPGKPWSKLGEAKRIELHGSPFGATRVYLEIMSLDPEFDSAYTGYCRLVLQNGKPQLAWNALQLYARNRNVNAPDGAQTSTSRNYDLILGRILQMRGEIDKAESRFENLLKSFPHDGEVIIALAGVVLLQGHTDEALSLATEALDVGNERRGVATAVINFYIDAGFADKATALLETVRGRESSKNIWANTLALRTFLRLGYVEHAAFVLAKMKRESLSNAHEYYLNGLLAEARGRFVQAEEWYLYSLSSDQRNTDLFRDAARASTSAKNFVRMEDDMNSVMLYLSRANYPADYVADARLQFAEFYASLNQWTRTLGELIEVGESFANTPRYELLRARALLVSRNEKSARDLFSQISSEHGSSFEWLRGLGMTYTMLEEFDSADVYIQKALELRPNDFVLLVARVDLALKKSDSAGYATAVREVVRAHPRNKRVLRIHADYFLSVGDGASALDVGNRMVELYPGDLGSYNFAASLSASSSGSQNGLHYYLKAQNENANIPAPLRNLASYYLRQGNIDSAIFYWERAFAIDTTDQASLLMKGVIVEARGFPDSAIAIYKHIVDVNPFSAEAFNNLAWVMANNDIEPAQASNFAREAVGLSGGLDGNMHGTLGWALFKEKKYKQANVSLQYAVRFSPRDPFKRFLFGSMLEEWGKKSEAGEQFQRAKELGISGGYLKEVEKALARLKG